jgi:hypothetical protein
MSFSNLRQQIKPPLSNAPWRLCLAGLLLLSGTGFAQSWGSVGAGYIYQTSEGPRGGWTSSNGWYVLPTFNINKRELLQQRPKYPRGPFWPFSRIREPNQVYTFRLYRYRQDPRLKSGYGCQFICLVCRRGDAHPPNALGIVPDDTRRICDEHCGLERGQQFCCKSRICSYDPEARAIISSSPRHPSLSSGGVSPPLPDSTDLSPKQTCHPERSVRPRMRTNT